MIRLISDVRIVLRAVDAEIPVIDPLLLRALVVAEDRRFFFHRGVDPIAIARAILHWIRWRKVEGASTIEAQLFRTITSRREISMARKLREFAGATMIALSRPKQRIATAYLGVAYFGFSTWGVNGAAEQLSINPSGLSITEACDLVSRLKRPSEHAAMHPANKALRERIEWLQSKMVKLQQKLGSESTF